MSATLLDERKYQKLLEEALPVVIHTDAEHQRLLAAAAKLMEQPEDSISEEHGRLLEMLAILIEEFEARKNPLPKSEPHLMLAYLIEEKGMKASDLWSTIPKSRVSEILSGKQGIGKLQAKRLAALFNVPVEAFL